MNGRAPEAQSQRSAQSLRGSAQSVRPDVPTLPADIPAPRADRRIGHRASAEGRYTRVARSFMHYPAPLDFRSLCARLISPHTRYLILDLDRTSHRGRNLGELLGWEIAAYECYGPALLERPPGVSGRFVWDPREPRRLPAYVLKNARTWAFPGLSYLLWGKLAERVPPLQRWSYRRFGSEPVQAVQRIPQTALLHRMTTLPETLLSTLAQRVWDRIADDQVIEAADLAWVRARAPQIQIILTSASPRPMLEVAGQALGVDAIEFSGTPAYQGRFSAPFWIDPRFALGDLDRIAAPDHVRINAGMAKIARLAARFPDLFAEGVESVGISDTGYGEDHVWAQYFTAVVDVNSTTPFSPVVAFDAPLREVHSARLRTRAERSAGGDPADVIPSCLQHWALSARLASARVGIEKQAAVCQRTEQALSDARSSLQQRLSTLHAYMGTSIARYNAAAPEQRAEWLAQLRRELRHDALLRKQLARVERPLSMARMVLTRQLRDARAALLPLASPSLATRGRPPG